MSEQTVIKGIVNRFHVQRYQEQGGYLSILSDADTLDWDDAKESFRYDGCTLILGNGFSEETVRKMLEQMIEKTATIAAHGWYPPAQVRSYLSEFIAKEYGIELNQRE